MAKAYIKYFELPLYPAYIGFTASKKAFTKEIKRLGIEELWREDSAAFTLAAVNNNDPNIVIIVGYNHSKTHTLPEVASILAHEATHVVQNIYDYIRERNVGREATAYLVQWLVYKMVKHIYGNKKI